LHGYDYPAMGDYFISVCTNNRMHHFGRIIKENDDPAIELTAIGSFVNDTILCIPVIYKDVESGEMVVMPNHIHLIISVPHGDTVYSNNQ
jgi:putative transposase